MFVCSKERRWGQRTTFLLTVNWHLFGTFASLYLITHDTNHRPQEIERTWLWAELEKVARFKKLQSSSILFQNETCFLGRIGKASLSEFPNIYVLTYISTYTLSYKSPWVFQFLLNPKMNYDYLKIFKITAGASSVCSSHSTALHSKFCGAYFNIDTATTAIGNIPICGKILITNIMTHFLISVEHFSTSFIIRFTTVPKLYGTLWILTKINVITHLWIILDPIFSRRTSIKYYEVWTM